MRKLGTFLILDFFAFLRQPKEVYLTPPPYSEQQSPICSSGQSGLFDIGTISKFRPRVLPGAFLKHCINVYLITRVRLIYGGCAFVLEISSSA